MIFFPNTIMKRYVYTDMATDVYGATVKDYVYFDDIKADLQNVNNVEVAKAYGVELQNLYKMYVHIDVELNNSDKFEDNQGNKYTVVGNIQEYNHYLNYKKVNLVIDRSDSL